MFEGVQKVERACSHYFTIVVTSGLELGILQYSRDIMSSSIDAVYTAESETIDLVSIRSPLIDRLKVIA